MKRITLVLAAITLLTLTGWGEQLPPAEQAHASVAAHKSVAKNNREKHRHHRWHHGRHHRKHHGA